jgi:hypothetical protein
VFLALEELGFGLMSIVFLVVAPVFAGSTKVERALRWILVSSFVATIGAFVAVSAVFGLDRQDTFEIIVISIVWLTLVIAGPLMAVAFRRASAPKQAVG